MNALRDWLLDHFKGEVADDEMRIDCPFCGDGSGHMYISLSKL